MDNLFLQPIRCVFTPYQASYSKKVICKAGIVHEEEEIKGILPLTPSADHITVDHTYIGGI
jgi:hypothetical protein